MKPVIKIANRDISEYVTKYDLKIEKVYKGEILRSHSGVIPVFPSSFCVVGVSISMTGAYSFLFRLQQILLSGSILTLAIKDGTRSLSMSGMFSLTSNSITSFASKEDVKAVLDISLVSVGSPITDFEGNLFTIKRNSTVITNSASFGQLLSIRAVSPLKTSEGYTLSIQSDNACVLLVTHSEDLSSV